MIQPSHHVNSGVGECPLTEEQTAMSSKQQAVGVDPPSDGPITATVGAVVTAVPEGKTPFVVAFPLPESATKDLTEDTSITFSLTNWSGDSLPEHGQAVKLTKVRRFARGWRASFACPVLTNSSKQ